MPYKDPERLRQAWREHAKHRARSLHLLIMARLNAICYICRTEPATEPDHVQPKRPKLRKMSHTQRYRHWIEELIAGNLRGACRTCNASKGDSHARNNPLPTHREDDPF